MSTKQVSALNINSFYYITDSKILKIHSEEIAPSLTAIFNVSINSGIFPDDFKTAIISPIYRSESKSSCDNYRPISVLSCVAKYIEKLIPDQLETYLESNGLLVEQQAGLERNIPPKHPSFA